MSVTFTSGTLITSDWLNQVDAIVDGFAEDSSGLAIQKGIREKVVALGSGTDIDVALGTIYSKTLSGNPTFTVSNAAAGSGFTLDVDNGGVARTITFGTGFTSILWNGGSQPTSSTGVDVYTFYTLDGSAWRAAMIGSYS
jgi:hypothetical protein